MTDLVERLKARGRPILPDVDPGDQDCWEAAEALERLGLLVNEHVSTIEKWQTAAEKAERELAEARAREERVMQAVKQAFEVIEVAPELNMSNYDDVQVSELNAASIQTWEILSLALRLAAPHQNDTTSK